MKKPPNVGPFMCTVGFRCQPTLLRCPVDLPGELDYDKYDGAGLSMCDFD